MLVVLFSSAYALSQAPTLTSISPTALSRGTQVTLTGSGFGTTQGGSGLVAVGTQSSGTVVSWSNTQIVITVPNIGFAPGNISVRQNGAWSNGIAYTVVPPTLTSISATALSPGMQVTLTGNGFGATQGGSGLVAVGTQASGTVVSWSNTQIVITVPSTGLQPGNISARQDGVWSNGIAYTVVPPTLTSISPTAISPGMHVTVTGTGFGATRGNGRVSLGTQASGTVVSWSDTQIVVTVPTGVVAGNASVTQYGVTSSGIAFTVVPAPSISSLSPTSGTVGTVVTISGNSLGSGQSAAVTFNGVAASPTTWTNTSVTVPVPTTATTGSVVVTIGGLPSNGQSFTVVPHITGLSPNTGAVGTAVTISGTTFGSSPGTVTFNGTTATPTIWSPSSITVPVPAGASTGSVAVTVGGVTGSGPTFTVTTGPIIASLNPSSAAVGALVQVIGQNLSATSQQTVVNIGNLQITDVQVSSDSTSAYFVVPQQGVASGALVVQVGGQSSNSLPFTLSTPPQVYSLSPLEVAPGAVLTISGVNFGANGATGNSLLVDGQSASFSSWSTSQITVQAPSAAGAHTATVVAGGSQSATLNFKVLSFGTITGTVTSSGAGVAGAIVQGVAGQSATTDNGGNFSFNSVPSGTYSVGATAVGYIPTIVNQVAVTAGANTSLQIQLSPPNPTQILIVPSGATVTVGGGQALTLVDQNGMPVTEPTWSVDDSTIASIDTTDNSLIGVAVGTTTVRAAWQSYQASIPVNVIGPANTLWSSQISGQQGPSLPLAKTGTGPDFVYSDGSNLYGMSYERGTLWKQSLQGLPNLAFSQAAADENGDFVVPTQFSSSTPTAIVKFYGTNGLPLWMHSFDAGVLAIIYSAVDSQGDVYAGIVDTTATKNSASLVELRSSDGQITLSVPIPDSETSDTGTSCNAAYDNFSTGAFGPVSVLSDGTVQLQVESIISRNHFLSPTCGEGGTVSENLSLLTISNNSVGKASLDSSTWSTLAGSTDVSWGMTLPDGNGGSVSIWEEITRDSSGGTASQTVFFGGPGGAGHANNLFPGVPAQAVLGSTGLLYLVGSQMDFSNVLVAWNISAGSEAWRIPFYNPNDSSDHYNLVAATGDGGFVFTNKEGVSRVDTSGNVTPDTDLSSYVGTSGAQSPGPLTYLGGPDGTLWASSSADTVVSDIADINAVPSGAPISDWQMPLGRGGANRAATVARWMDADTNTITVSNQTPNGPVQSTVPADCGGFDVMATTPILVVPVGGTNTVQLNIEGRNLWRTVTLQSDTPSVTITNPNQGAGPTGGTTLFTVHGGSTPVLARIKAINSNGTNLATLRVAVKHALDTTIGPGFNLDLYRVTEANENLSPTNVPSFTQVQAALDKTWLKEANVHFSVTTQSPFSVHYDLNGDRRLQEPATGTYDYQSPETSAIFYFIKPDANSNGGGSTNQHRFVAYVHDIQPQSTLGFAGFNAYIQDTTNNGQDVKTAHEIGHTLGIAYNTHDQKELMNEQDTGVKPCRIRAEQWNIANPTGDSGHPSQWELAPPQPQDQ